MGTENELASLVEQLQRMAQTAAADHELASPDLRDILHFLGKVVEVVDQAFRDVYATLIEFKYLTPADLAPDRIGPLRMKLDLLVARDHFRDAEIICARLHALGQQFIERIGPLLGGQTAGSEWNQIMMLLDQHEGRIIGLVHHAISDLQMLLGQVTDETSLPAIRQEATAKSDAIYAALTELQTMQNRILGLSGGPGLLELTMTDRRQLEESLIVIQGDHTEYNVTANNTSGMVAVGSGIHQERAESAASSLTPQEAAALLAQMRQLITQEPNLPQAVKDRALLQLDVAGAEAAAETPDKGYIATTLTKATETLKQAGGVVTAATAFGQLLQPLAAWLGTTAHALGL